MCHSFFFLRFFVAHAGFPSFLDWIEGYWASRRGMRRCDGPRNAPLFSQDRKKASFTSSFTRFISSVYSFLTELDLIRFFFLVFKSFYETELFYWTLCVFIWLIRTELPSFASSFTRFISSVYSVLNWARLDLTEFSWFVFFWFSRVFMKLNYFTGLYAFLFGL